MDGLFRCVLYLAAIGILLFIVGRVLPKEKFQFSKFPFRGLAVEKEETLYRKLGVQKWKDKVPDMSRVCPAWISSKKLPRSPSANQMERMIPVSYTHLDVYKRQEKSFSDDGLISASAEYRFYFRTRESHIERLHRYLY